MPSLLPIFNPIGELLTDKKLQDKDLLEKPVLLQAQESFSFEADKLPITYSISAQGQLSVNLFNDENDADDLDLAGTGAEATLSFDPNKEAFLKYDLQVFPKCKISGTIQDIGLLFNRERGIRATWYQKHSNQITIQSAFKEDLADFKSIFIFKDLEKTQNLGALAYSVEGELQASVKVSWSNLLSKSINLIPSLLKKPVTLDLDISPKLTADFDLTIKDHFSYFLKKESDGFSVSICKIKNSALAGGIGASIGIKLANSQALEKQMDELLEKACLSLTEKSPKFISKALEAAKSNQSNETENKVLENLAGLLGIEDWKEGVEVLSKRWEDFQDKFKKGLEESAETGAQLTFKYEFSRIKEGKELLKAHFSTAGSLEKYHADFLKFDLKPFLKDYSSNNTQGVTLQSYFNQTRIITESNWGFGLKIWKKEFLSGKDFRKREALTIRDIRQHQQVSISAFRGYQWNLGNDKGKWLSQFDANMPSFSLALEPVIPEFEFGWTLKRFEENIKIKNQGNLRSVLDSAANWGCILPDAIETLAAKHFPLLSGQNVTVQKQIYFPNQVLEGLFIQIFHLKWNEPLKRLLAKSLASSLRYVDDFALRRDPAIREIAYEAVWKYFLDNPRVSPSSLARITSDHLRGQTNQGLLLRSERDAGRNNQGLWLADVVYTNSYLFDHLTAGISGISDLGEALLVNKPFANQFEIIYKKIERFLGQSFYLEVLGNFLLRTVQENPLAAESVEETFTIAYGPKGEEKTIHLGVV